MARTLASQDCQDNPDVATACFVYAGGKNSASEAAVVSVGWDWTDNNNTNNAAGPELRMDSTETATA